MGVGIDLPRILFLDHTAALSGGELAMLRLIGGLDRSRFIPVVLLFSDGPLVGELKSAGVETHVMALPTSILQTRKDTLGLGTLFRGRDGLRLLNAVRRVAYFIRSKAIDLIHTNSLKADVIGGLAGRLAGVKVVWHVRDRIADDYLPPSATTAFRALCRVLPNHVIANSRATLATIGNGIHGTSVPSGIPLARLKGVSVHPSGDSSDPGSLNGNARHYVRVGLVGRISPWKGQDVFLRAAARVIERFPSARFEIIGGALFGEAAFERELHRLVRDLRLEEVVRFLGFRSDVEDLIAGLDLVVHASTLPEPFGQVVVEAMAAGKPVVATDGGGIPEILSDGETGLLVPMNDHVAMAQAILKLVQDEPMRLEMGRRGRQYVIDHFTIEQSVEKVQGIYANLLEDRDGHHNGKPVSSDNGKPVFGNDGFPIQRAVPAAPAIKHFAVNAHLLSSNAGYRQAGVSRYISSLLAAMWQEESVVRWTVYGPPGVDRVLSAAPVTARISASRLPTSRPTARIAWEQFIAPGLFAREAPDVLLCPLNVAPLMTPCPIVLVIHDLAFIRLRLHRRERRLYLSALTRLSVRKAAHIIAVSDFTRGEIIDLFGIAPEKVTTIHNGCDERFSAATKESMEAFRLRRNLPERFLLFVGTLEPRKNLIGLLRAYAKIRDKIGLPLIIVGGRGWRYTPIFALVHAERLDGAVRFEGFVDDEDLPMYYRAATALIYPSLYEGFGLPPLEAMASGTPVLTTRVASMPEVVGDAAMLVSPGDDDALADAMFKISSDERLRDDLIKAGLKRVEQFNWARTAVETLRILHDAAGTAF